MNARTLVTEAFKFMGARPLAVFVALVAAEMLTASVLAPLTAWGTRHLVRQSGHYAIANQDLVGFALSFHGLLTVALVSISWIVGGALARAGVMAACQSGRGGFATGLSGASRALSRTLTLAALAARQFVTVAVLVSPWLAALGVIVWFTLRGVDANWIVSERPLRFWIGATCAAPVTLAAAWIATRRILLWSIALPCCVLEQRAPAAALAQSHAALAQHLLPIAVARVSWFLGVSLIGACMLALTHQAGETVLRQEFSTLVRTAMAAGAVLAVVVCITGIISALHTAGDAVVCFVVWRRTSGVNGWQQSPAACESAPSSRPGARSLMMAALGVLALAAMLGSVRLLHAVGDPVAVELSAHRGDERHAPENTLAALESAIVAGADRVEIDVMRTLDDALVLSHDTDLRRIAGDPRRIRDMTLAEVRAIDAGAWFNARFAGERIPTLDQVLQQARGRVALNIEIKPAGDDEQVAVLVARALRRELEALPGVSSDRGVGRVPIIVTTLSARVLEAFRREAVPVPSGLIASVAVGDLRRIDADLFSLEARLVTDSVLEHAKATDKPVHVWGVRDLDDFTRLALRGIDGVIAADVRPFRQRLAEIAALDAPERLLLAFRPRLLE